MVVHLLALLVLGLMCGSELNIALIGHPVLRRQPLETHVLVRSSLAALLGRVMPFWMGGSTLLNLLLLLGFEQLSKAGWRLAAIAFAIQALAVLFSLVGPVPINNRIAKWAPKSLPEDWSRQENRWDIYHFVRTCGLIVAFALVALSFHAR
jgi:uncharacterized membrane protein